MKYLGFLFFFFIFNFINLSGQEEKSTKSDPNIPIFEIKNDLGQTVFAVYPGGVHIFVDDTQLKATGGGFKVGRIGTEKATLGDILTVAPGEVNVYLDNPVKATGGGFKVGRIGTEKAGGIPDNYMTVTPDSTRIYTVEESNKGFAAGKLSTMLGVENFLNLTPENYFIGHESGRLTTGTYNLFFGYRAGYNNTTGARNFFAGYGSGLNNTLGDYNVFIGAESGTNNVYGIRNIFVGYRAGFANEGDQNSTTIGHDNIYIGTRSGEANVTGEHNTLIGSFSGYTSDGTKNTFVGAFTGFDASGIANVFLGVDAGRNNTAGDNNTFLGTIAGNSNSGSNNTFVGYGAGYFNTSGTGNVFLGYLAGPSTTDLSNKLYIDNSSTTSPLIYGDFDLNRLAFNGNVGINRTAYSNVSLGVSPGSQTYGIYVDAGATYAAYFNGPTWCTSGTWAGSDVRYKKNIEKLNGSLEKILKLRGVSYEWKTEEFKNNGFNDGETIGLIAQELEKVIPELVMTGPDGFKAVAYDKLTAVIIEGMKEQQSQIENLKQENEKLREEVSEIEKLRQEIDDLKKLTNKLSEKVLNSNMDTN